MKNIFHYTATLLLLAGVFAFTTIPSWKLAKGYSIKVSGKGVTGAFSKCDADIFFDAQRLADSKLNFSIYATSFDTGNEMQNKYAYSAEWLNTEKYPIIHFTSASILQQGAGYTVKGSLEIKGKTKELEIPVQFSETGAKGIFSATFTIRRSDYGVGPAIEDIADDLKIEAVLPVKKQKV